MENRTDNKVSLSARLFAESDESYLSQKNTLRLKSELADEARRRFLQLSRKKLSPPASGGRATFTSEKAGAFSLVKAAPRANERVESFFLQRDGVTAFCFKMELCEAKQPQASKMHRPTVLVAASVVEHETAKKRPYYLLDCCSSFPKGLAYATTFSGGSLRPISIDVLKHVSFRLHEK